MEGTKLSRRGVLLTGAALTGIASCGGGGGAALNSGGASSSASSSSASSSSAPALPDPASAPALKTHFSANFDIGLVADDWVATDAGISALVTKHASSMTAESIMKPVPIASGGAGTYDFAAADRLIAFCQSKSIKLRGHALVWHQTAPAWFFAGTPTDPGYKALVQARLETYITDVVTHFKGKVYAWDVVNEATSDDGSQTYRNSVWYQALGADFIPIAFRAARAADPTVKLFLNDYGTEDPAKRARFLTILDALLAAGVPVDGVGHQCHVNTGVNVTEVGNALSAVDSRGLINHVTELDISLYNDPGSCYSTPSACLPELTGTALNTALHDQAVAYQALFTEFTRHLSLKVVTMWGTSDAHSWLNSFPLTRTNYPLLFDRSGNPKSAFWAVVDPTFVIP